MMIFFLEELLKSVYAPIYTVILLAGTRVESLTTAFSVQKVWPVFQVSSSAVVTCLLVHQVKRCYYRNYEPRVTGCLHLHQQCHVRNFALFFPNNLHSLRHTSLALNGRERLFVFHYKNGRENPKI